MERSDPLCATASARGCQVGAGDSGRDIARLAERDVPRASWDAGGEGCFQGPLHPPGCAGEDSGRHCQHRLRTRQAASAGNAFKESTENGGMHKREISNSSVIPSNKPAASVVALDPSVWGDATIRGPRHPQSATDHISKATDRPDHFFSYVNAHRLSSSVQKARPREASSAA